MWTNVSSFSHTATQNQGFFDTGTVSQEGSASKVFKFGGTFPYHCQFHGTATSGMRGRIDVLIKWLNEGPQHPGDEQRIRVASVKAPAPLAFDVQMRVTGEDAWTPFKQKVTTAVVKFTPNEAGEFQFRLAPAPPVEQQGQRVEPADVRRDRPGVKLTAAGFPPGPGARTIVPGGS